MKIKRVKKNPYIINKEIRFRLMMCGLGQIIDGLVMFLLFGEVTSNFALITAKKMAKRRNEIEEMKAKLRREDAI